MKINNESNHECLVPGPDYTFDGGPVPRRRLYILTNTKAALQQYLAVWDNLNAKQRKRLYQGLRRIFAVTYDSRIKPHRKKQIVSLRQEIEKRVMEL